MRLQFEPNLAYQQDAIAAVRDLFRGQERVRGNFTVAPEVRGGGSLLPMDELTLGIGNRLSLGEEELLANLHDVQMRNNIAPSEAVALSDLNFTVEMETGTGKTYVYLRTIMELNREYGFTKFIIVVPSVAIKEGVFKSLQITDEHLRALYGGTPITYFMYDSGNLGRVRAFATSNQVEVMVVTVGAINKKDVNNIYGKGDNEDTDGDRPIDLVAATRPIVIVDEPQSVDGPLEGGRGKEALAAMQPLCTLRYSATHAAKYHMVYRLDAVDAYEGGLVKRISVASAVVDDAHNTPYFKVIAINAQKGVIYADCELDVADSAGVRRMQKRLQAGDDLWQTSGRREVYRDHCVDEIRRGKGACVLLQIPGDFKELAVGDSYADVDRASVVQLMIRRTIQEHLDKEKTLLGKGIKVLTLFFIDSVDLYRGEGVDKEKQRERGLYRRLFEKEYERARKLGTYDDLFDKPDFSHPTAEVHEGYFSIDKKGNVVDTEANEKGELTNDDQRKNAERAYQLIMRDKEKLLLLSTPLKFIFSHSALREGWDNPNVFQICAFREMNQERERRQTIGRGLRLCVNQNGDRIRDPAINELTVIANERYQDFADKLQKEIEAETGITFGMVTKDIVAAIRLPAVGDKPTHALGQSQSETLLAHFRDKGYIDARGNAKDELKLALKNNSLDVPQDLKPHQAAIETALRKVVRKLDVRNADQKPRRIATKRSVLDDAKFKELWSRIQAKTTYRVQFELDALIKACVATVRDATSLVPQARLHFEKAPLVIDRRGTDADHDRVQKSAGQTLQQGDVVLPDLLGALQDKTALTRKTIAAILQQAGTLDQFKRNPQYWIQKASAAIDECKKAAILEGVRYVRIGELEVYAQELLETEAWMVELKQTYTVENEGKSPFAEVPIDADSKPELEFAKNLDHAPEVKVFTKLPAWFTVPTPLGPYNPDWAVLIEIAGEERLYFVAETKSTSQLQLLRPAERSKVECGRRHFETLAATDAAVRYDVVTSVDELLAKAAA